MALQVKNAPGQAGYVLLVFDQDIDASPLRLAICDRISRTYLGHSVGRANWSPARSHFFEAVLVSRGDGETVFKVGPEVTTFIPNETTVELTSEDGAVREVTFWRDILLDFHWRGPDVDPDDEARRRREEDNLQRERNDAERRRREAEAERQRQAVEDEEKRKLAARAGDAERMRREAEAEAKAERQRQETENEKKRELEAKQAEAEATRRQAEADRQRKEAEEEEKRLAAKAADAEKQRKEAEEEKQREEEKRKEAEENRKQAEEEAKRKQAEEKALQANLIASGEESQPAEEDRGKKARARVYQGMTTAFAAIVAFWFVSWGVENRVDLCNRFGLFCGGTASQPAPDFERAAFEGANICAAGTPCGVGGCVADYRRVYPDGRFKAEIDAIVAAKGLSCPNDPEKDVYDRATACAAPKSCDANGCLAEYRRIYPNGRFKSQIDRISATKGRPCDAEREVYDRAIACAAPLPCGADYCLAEYRLEFPNGNFRVQINTLAATKGPACPVQPTLPPFVRRTSEDPGINCAKSNLEPIEEMICADGDIARVNGELQRVFDAKRQTLRGTARDALVNQERAWIQSRDRDCNVPSRGPWTQMDLRKVKNCVVEKTGQRRDELHR
jgi:hypothetical protein